MKLDKKYEYIKIPLVRDTIESDDIAQLIEWLKTDPRLTKGNETIKLEAKWAQWLGTKYAVFLNSGSSANLAMIYALMLSKRMKNNIVIAPAVSWATTVSPLIQLGLTPYLCECDRDTLGVDITHLRKLFEEHHPAVLIIVPILAFPNKMKDIIDLCQEYDIILLEDSCESVGSTYNGIKTGNFGLMSTFSTYYGHHFSSIEGGFVSTNDMDLYRILLAIRSHGWDRDFEDEYQQEIRQKYNISNFRSLYTFYYPGFNIRSTDLQAYLAIKQMDKLPYIVSKRNENYLLYDSLIANDYWKIKNNNQTFISNFAYPIIHPNIKNMVEDLTQNGIDCRPLVCGSIGKQPFWIDLYGETNLEFANIVHNYGMYLPNNHQMIPEEIELICKIINRNI